jgi:hypothetical protein
LGFGRRIRTSAANIRGGVALLAQLEEQGR